MTMKRIFEMLGIEPNTTGHREKLISAGGGFFSILLAMWGSSYFLDPQGSLLLIASMGASATLLFVVPHGPFSQPWSLVAGHSVAALAGVACAQTIPDPLLAAPLAVSLAIASMYYLRCLHPPGGGTALAAVVGGGGIHALGYQFVVTPVLLNVIFMLLAAIVWNNLFAWRRYPASIKKAPADAAAFSAKIQESMAHADFSYALREIGSYQDISEGDLVKICKLASKHALRASREAGMLVAGNYYSNGDFGGELSVRKLLELEEAPRPEDAKVTYQVVAGAGEGGSGTMTKAEFMAWRHYEVIPTEGGWHRIMEL